MNPNLDTLLNLAEWNADPSVFYRGVNLWKTGRVMGDKEIESIFDTKSEHEGEILEYVAATDIFEIAATYAGALDVEWMVKMGSKKEDINMEGKRVRIKPIGRFGSVLVHGGETGTVLVTYCWRCKVILDRDDDKELHRGERLRRAYWYHYDDIEVIEYADA